MFFLLFKEVKEIPFTLPIFLAAVPHFFHQCDQDPVKEAAVPRKQRFVVQLTQDERVYLQRSHTQSAAPRRKALHSQILLFADQSDNGSGWTDERIAEALGTSAKTVGRVRERYARFGLPRAIERKEHSQFKPRRLDSRAETRLLELVGSPPPQGHDQWTLRLLAERLVEMDVVDEISHETVRRYLKTLSTDHSIREPHQVRESATSCVPQPSAA